ncbi:MAG TPA: RICIN domain-containing protein, partial [Chitinophagaceae bacterium]
MPANCSKLSIALAFASFFSLISSAQLPPGTKPNTKLPVPVKPTIKKDTVKYVAAPVTVRAAGRIATADELYMGNGNFLIRTARDYKYIIQHTDLSHSSILWEFAESPRQTWNFLLQPDGKYKIKNGDGECLQWGGSSSFYIVSKPESSDVKQLWQVENASHGNAYLRASNGKYLGVYDATITNGEPMSLRDKETAGHNQKWHLIKMSNDGRKVTSFVPQTHGFRFVNTFSGEDIIRWGGLCGGMVYAALDYFNNRIPVPIQTYTPANRTALQSYLYERQQHSMWNVNEKWSELEVAYNTRGGEIFRWGMQSSGGGRLEELKGSIDAGLSRPIGLFVGGVKSAD